MAKIQFENGVTVEFDGDPTPEDIEEVAAQLGAGGAGQTDPDAPDKPPAVPKTPAKPKTSIGQDILTGISTTGRTLGKNLGIPGTDYDLNALLEGIGARPMSQVRKEYEEAGPAAGVSRFVADTALTAPFGGAAVKAVQVAGKAIPSLGAASTAAAHPRLAQEAGRAARAGIEGGLSSALSGEGELSDKLASGAVGGIVGDRVIRGALKPITGLGAGAGGIHPDAKKLLESGIPVTMGRAQPDTIPGRMIRGIEDTATSIPVVADVMVAGHKSGMKALSKKMVEAGLPPGMKAPSSSGAQPLKALEEVGEEFSKRYDKALSQGGEQSVPPGYADSLISRSFVDPDAFITPDRAAHAEKRIRNAVNFKSMTPKQLFKAQSDLRAASRKLASRKAATAEDEGVAAAYQAAADDILEGLETGMPDKDLSALKGPYRNYVNFRQEVEKGVGHGENLTVKQMQVAAQKSGNKELEELTRAAGSVLPSRIPDSGTPRRLAAQGAFGAGLGAGAYALGGAGLGLALPGLLATRPGGAKFLMGQLPKQQKLARFLEKYSATAGGVGSNYTQ